MLRLFFPQRFPSLVLRKAPEGYIMYNQKVLCAKDGPWEETVNRGNFFHNYSNVFLFLRTSEEPCIVPYCPCTVTIKLSHRFINIAERRGAMESYRLLQRYSHKIHNVTVDIICHTWHARTCLRGGWKGKTKFRCVMLLCELSTLSFINLHTKPMLWAFSCPRN